MQPLCTSSSCPWGATLETYITPERCFWCCSCPTLFSTAEHFISKFLRMTFESTSSFFKWVLRHASSHKSLVFSACFVSSALAHVINVSAYASQYRVRWSDANLHDYLSSRHRISNGPRSKTRTCLPPSKSNSRLTLFAIFVNAHAQPLFLLMAYSLPAYSTTSCVNVILYSKFLTCKQRQWHTFKYSTLSGLH